jgi:hypothetical protein|tara:strand:- start:112 stop:510 length:399 start_codon:yes stop_codon:yes gene_type:complete
MVLTNTYRTEVNNYISSIPNWNYSATIRRHYKLNLHNSEKLMDRLFKWKYINKIFWVLENDTTGYNHLHLLLDSTLLGNYADIKDEMNTYLGGKKNAMCFSWLQPIQPSEVNYYIGYCTKKLSGNGGYGILI